MLPWSGLTIVRDAASSQATLPTCILSRWFRNPGLGRRHPDAEAGSLQIYQFRNQARNRAEHRLPHTGKTSGKAFGPLTRMHA